MAKAMEVLQPYQVQIEQLQQLVESMMPPPMVDPTQAQLQIAQMNAQTQVQTAQLNAQTNAQSVQLNAQAKQQDLQLKAQVSDKQLQLKEAELQFKVSNADQKLNVDQTINERNIEVTQQQMQQKDRELQAKVLLEAQKLDQADEALAQKQAEADLKAKTELAKNMQDNITATNITQMRIENDMAAGNLKDGDGIDPGNV
jgi:hypothetical protein